MWQTVRAKRTKAALPNTQTMDPFTDQDWQDAAEREGLVLLASLVQGSDTGCMMVGETGERYSAETKDQCFVTWLALTDEQNCVTGKQQICYLPSKATKARIVTSMKFPRAHHAGADPWTEIPKLSDLVAPAGPADETRDPDNVAVTSSQFYDMAHTLQAKEAAAKKPRRRGGKAHRKKGGPSGGYEEVEEVE